MIKNEILTMLIDAIENGDYKSISKQDRNELINIMINFGKGAKLFVNEDNSVYFCMNITSHFPYTYQDLMSMTDEALRAQREEKINKWKEQIDVLQQKIEDGEDGFVKGIPIPDKHKKSFEAMKQRCRDGKTEKAAAREAKKEENEGFFQKLFK